MNATEVAGALLDGFVDALDAVVAPVVPTRRADFLRAVATTPLPSVERLYWIARVTLVSDVGQIADFDRLFDAWFRHGLLELMEDAMPPPGESPLDRPPGTDADAPVPTALGEGGGARASRDDLPGRRLIDRADPEEHAAWLRTRAAARDRVPRQPGRRHRPTDRRGEIDLRRTLRTTARSDGEIAVLRRRHRPSRPRRLLVLIDVSGSLKADSPRLLQFAHALVHGTPRVEVFTFGTRLTRVTRELRERDLDAALAALAPVVADFDGGTRIGESLGRLLANRRHLPAARGAIVLVLSDGLERGDPGPMAAAVERLTRLGHRVVWLTPLMGDPAYRPLTRGLRAVLPLVDRLGDASSATALLRELSLLEPLERRPRHRAAEAFAAERGAA